MYEKAAICEQEIGITQSPLLWTMTMTDYKNKGIIL